jgi:hypothetical protein
VLSESQQPTERVTPLDQVERPPKAISGTSRPVPRVSSRDQQNRLRLLKRVYTIWIEGLLERSLHQASLIALDLQEQPDALANPWHLEVQESNRPPHPLPTGTSIVQVYDESDGELLLLGEPGAGKTTLLLELARTLLKRAEADEHERLPVVFSLSSWAEKRPQLSDWLIEELRTKYEIPRTVGEAWIATDQILPLLDGLDEVAEGARPDCVRAINSYYQSRLEKGPTPLVVCCRSKEYRNLPTSVALYRAVSIRPLTDDQIERYLQSAKGQLQELWHALQQDPELYELVRWPLMLSIFTLAYQGAARADLPTEGTPQAQQRQVFASYVKRMLQRREGSKRSSLEQTRRWLTFVAAGMQQHHQTVFYLECLQPDWLRGRDIRLLYRLSVGLFAGLVCGSLVGLVSVSGLVAAPFDPLILGLAYGLITELFFGWGQIRPKERLTLFDDRLRFTPNQGIRRSVQNGLIFGLIFGLIVGAITAGSSGLNFGLIFGLLFGLFSGLLFGLGAFFQHFALRFWLWRANSLPRNVAAFLDEAAERLLLRKVGGGYIFIHRLLLDYFASFEA